MVEDEKKIKDEEKVEIPKKVVHFESELLDAIKEKRLETPFIFYDKEKILNNLNEFLYKFFYQEFGKYNFRNYYSVKANPHPYFLNLFSQHNKGFFDVSSPYELELLESLHIPHDHMMITSNFQRTKFLKKVIETNAILNFDNKNEWESIKHEKLVESLGHFSFRLNLAGLLNKNKMDNNITGVSEDSKFGINLNDLMPLYEQVAKNEKLRKKANHSLGIHTSAISNCLDIETFSAVAKIMFEQVREIKKQYGIELNFVNLGGGLGIPYKLDEEVIFIKELAKEIKLHYDVAFSDFEKNPMLFLESGRFVMGDTGYLLASVTRTKVLNNKFYLGIDVPTANLTRLNLYDDSYHHVQVLYPTNRKKALKKDMKMSNVVGSLCENNDIFGTFNLPLGKLRYDDLTPKVLIVFDVGAHVTSMSTNYNGNFRLPEYVVSPSRDGLVIKEITRRETFEDLTSRYVDRIV